MASPKRSSSKRNAPALRPDGELRQSQMITTYGPGSLVDLVNDAILVPGLEYWSYSGAAGYTLHEERLAENLRRRLQGVTLSPLAPFRSPPVSLSDEPQPQCGIRAVEFPSWFVCPAAECERLIHKQFTELKDGRRTHRCTHSGKVTTVVPVRFVTACRNGHLDDFPWNWFVHQRSEGDPIRCDAPELRLVDRGSGDLSDVYVRCQTCDSSRSVAEARRAAGLPRCRGLRPWLGAHPEDEAVRERDCTEDQRVLVRTASNSYFAQVESALTIPRTSRLGEDVHDFMVKHYRDVFALVQTPEQVAMVRQLSPIVKHGPAAIRELDDAALWQAIEIYRAELDAELRDEHVRETEYRSILNAKVEPGHYLYSSADLDRDRDFTAVRPAEGTCPLPPGIQDVVLLERLREIRVLTGFTRLEPPAQNVFGEFDLDSRVAAVSAGADWLPAIEVRGEGFFIELDLKRLEAWEAKPEVRAREAALRDGFYARFPPRGDGPQHEFLGIRFYLLHTLAHLLMTQVALECGYSASAIRERIYCSMPGTAGRSMAGILLSTGSSGTEGTLGGLVEQGRRISYHLRQALETSRLCSHDPVCARRQPGDGHPGRALLGAACHGCMFVAECSCERANQYLDRALVVPTVCDRDLAFFSEEELRRLPLQEVSPTGSSARPTELRVAPPHPPRATIDLEDFDAPWHSLLLQLSNIDDLTIEPGGDVSKDGRVVGAYAMLLRRRGHALYVVDAKSSGQARITSTLVRQGQAAIALDPESASVDEVLETLE